MIKQVIVMRTKFEKDGKLFKMRRGKELAQAGHAAMKWITKKLEKLMPQLNSTIHKDMVLEDLFSDIEIEWLTNQQYAKIVLQVETEQELLDLQKKCEEAGIQAILVHDLGYTEFNEKTYTCLAIGPDRSEKIDPITKDLKLL